MLLEEAYPDQEHQIYCEQPKVIKTLREVLNLFDTKVVCLEQLPKDDVPLIQPKLNWSDLSGTERILYKKAKDLPVKKKNQITVQVSSRCHHSLEIKPNEFNFRVLPKLPAHAEIINLGDDNLPGTRDMGKATIREKLDLIAQSQVHLSINSGTTHLALLTNTHVVVFDRSHGRKLGPLEDHFKKTDQIDFTLELGEAIEMVLRHYKSSILLI